MKSALSFLILLFLFNSLYAIEPNGKDWNLFNEKFEPSNSLRLSNNNSTRNALFSLEYGRVISAFDYLNSDGEKLDNLLGSTNNHIAIGGKMPIKRSNFYFVSTLSYNTYAATGSDALVGNYYDWKVNYLGVNIGIGYEFFKLNSYRNSPNITEGKGFTLFTQITCAADFLVQGTQTINSQVYDLVGVEQFDKPFIFARAGIGMCYYASRALSVYVQYMGGMGFSVFKSESDDQEDLNYITHTISLGVQISLPSYRR